MWMEEEKSVTTNQESSTIKEDISEAAQVGAAFRANTRFQDLISGCFSFQFTICCVCGWRMIKVQREGRLYKGHVFTLKL